MPELKREALYWVRCATLELADVHKLLEQDATSSALSKLAELQAQLARASARLEEVIQAGAKAA